MIQLQVSAYVHSGNPRVSAVVRHLSSHQWKLAILVRFIPIPIGVQSGILAVRCSAAAAAAAAAA